MKWEREKPPENRNPMEEMNPGVVGRVCFLKYSLGGRVFIMSQGSGKLEGTAVDTDDPITFEQAAREAGLICYRDVESPSGNKYKTILGGTDLTVRQTDNLEVAFRRQQSNEFFKKGGGKMNENKARKLAESIGAGAIEAWQDVYCTQY